MSAGFVMVPAWLRRKKPSGNALLVYVNLAAFGTFNPETGVYEECRPAVATLAEECGLSLSPTKRALAELYGLGAIERRACFDDDGGRAPSIYRVRFGTLVEAPGPQEDQGGGPLEDQGADQQKPAGGLGGWAAGELGDRPLASQNLEPSTKKNINTGDAREASAEIIDTAGQGVVWSGTTSPLEEYQRTVREAVEMIMTEWRKWRTERALIVSRDNDADARRQIHELIAEVAKDGGDLTPYLRAVWRGLVEWTREGYAAHRLPDFVRKASAAGIAPAARPAAPSKAQQRFARAQDVVAAFAGKNITPQMARDMLDAATLAGINRNLALEN